MILFRLNRAVWKEFPESPYELVLESKMAFKIPSTPFEVFYLSFQKPKKHRYDIRNNECIQWKRAPSIPKQEFPVFEINLLSQPDLLQRTPLTLISILETQSQTKWQQQFAIFLYVLVFIKRTERLFNKRTVWDGFHQSLTQSRRHGGLWWVYLPKRSSKSPKLKYETL